MATRQSYTSTHFDAPNYVAHMRLNERVDAKGKQGLFIEELQSDRHQQGREKGYANDFSATEYAKNAAAQRDITARMTQIEQQLRRKYHDKDPNPDNWVGYDEDPLRVKWQELRREKNELAIKAGPLREEAGIPDAPFRTSWPLQLFKRALRDAVTDGKDWIGWTTGETQAARYDLSKQVAKVYWNEADGGTLTAEAIGGYQFPVQKDVPREKLPDVIGKDAAQRMIALAPDEYGDRTLKGDDLKVGGEGMKGFYDNMVPKEVAKHVKQWGAQVEKSQVKPTINKRVSDMSGAELVQYIERPNELIPIWRVNITPQMREGIKKAGQALFMPDTSSIAENFNSAQQATGGSLRPILDQPENAPVVGRITPAQEESIRELDEYYRRVTPQRIKALRNDAIDSLANRLINKGIPVAEARGLATETYKKIKGRVAGASQVISGMGKSDLSRMAGTGRPAVPTRKGVNPNWLTSAFEAFESDNDLALMKAQQVAKQLNKKQQAEVSAGKSVDAARASKVRVSTVDLGMQFLIGEGTADKKAFGSSLREDPAAPPRVYASVVEGQKFGSQGNYAVFFEWKKSSPIVATSHHHYGVGNGLTDIHASANIGDKNARSFGNPKAETYDTLPSGRKVLNTRLLVGNAGLDDIRTHQLLVSIPESALSGVRAMYKKGGFSSVKSQLNDIAVRSLVGTKSQGKTKALTSKDGIPVMVAIQKNRTEAYVLNPDLRNVESITIVENKNKEKDTALIRKNLAAAFKNNGSPMPRIKVVSAESGPSGNRGRSKITDEFFNLTGKVVYGAALGGLAASQTDDNR